MQNVEQVSLVLKLAETKTTGSAEIAAEDPGASEHDATLPSQPPMALIPPEVLRLSRETSHYLLPNILAHVSRAQTETIAAILRAIFVQPNADRARRQLIKILTHLQTSLPEAAAVLADAEDGAIA